MHLLRHASMLDLHLFAPLWPHNHVHHVVHVCVQVGEVVSQNAKVAAEKAAEVAKTGWTGLKSFYATVASSVEQAAKQNVRAALHGMFPATWHVLLLAWACPDVVGMCLLLVGSAVWFSCLLPAPHQLLAAAALHPLLFVVLTYAMRTVAWGLVSARHMHSASRPLTHQNTQPAHTTRHQPTQRQPQPPQTDPNQPQPKQGYNLDLGAKAAARSVEATHASGGSSSARAYGGGGAPPPGYQQMGGHDDYGYGSGAGGRQQGGYGAGNGAANGAGFAGFDGGDDGGACVYVRATVRLCFLRRLSACPIGCLQLDSGS